MEIGVKKEEGMYRHVREWRPMAIAFNETDAGVLVIASVPTGKLGDEMLGSRCEIHLRPDGTYWGEINANFAGYGKQSKPRLPMPKEVT
jgi:hypothetical protein